MPEYVEYKLHDNRSILVETDLVNDPLRPAAASTARKAKQEFDEVVSAIEPVVRAIQSKLERVRPDELVVELGIKLGADAGVVLAKASSEAHLKLELKWTRSASRP